MLKFQAASRFSSVASAAAAESIIAVITHPTVARRFIEERHLTAAPMDWTADCTGGHLPRSYLRTLDYPGTASGGN